MNIIAELPKVLKDIDIPLKISAGPGAGKTTWLVSHVQNVLKNSNNLGKMQKVACITYTRIGAETVNKKIKELTGTNRLDIGTIHSFLYSNVIKPFFYLIAFNEINEVLFDVNNFCGLIENRLNLGRFSSWRQTKPFYLFDEKLKDKAEKTNLEKTIFCLNNIDWKLDGEEIKIGITKKFRPPLLIKKAGTIIEIGISNEHLHDYKKAHWRKGIMHHEDVLYFTHYIFKNNPRIVEFVSNKFPYLFLDEFQDTNPLQTWIIKQIADKGTNVGVIGDPAQSIFEFAGARRKDFHEFILPEMQNFKKSKNYRSSVTIIDFLKELRDDILQEPKKNALVGDSVSVIVGEEEDAINYLEGFDKDNFVVLCRSNKDVNRLKHNLKKVEGSNLVNLLYSEDSNHQRPIFIHSLLKAYDFHVHSEFKEANKEIKKHFRGVEIESIEKRRLAIQILDYLNANLDTSIEDIYNYLQPVLKKHSIKLAGVRKPINIHKQSFRDFIPFLSKQTKISDKIRTIHQAKGDEFKNVLLCLNDKTNKNGGVSKKLETILQDYIFNSKRNIALDSEVGEETRLVYVACSRAQERLFINVPRLSKEEELKMIKLGMIVERN